MGGERGCEDQCGLTGKPGSPRSRQGAPRPPPLRGRRRGSGSASGAGTLRRALRWGGGVRGPRGTPPRCGRPPSPPAPCAPGPPLMPAMVVTSLLAPGPEAAAVARRPETRGGGDETTPGSARRSTSAGGSHSRGGRRGRAGWGRAADPFLPCSAAPQVAALRGFSPSPTSGACRRRPDAPPGWRKLPAPRDVVLFDEEEGAPVAADLWGAWCDGPGEDFAPSSLSVQPCNKGE